MDKDMQGKELGIGYLWESPDGDGRLFCRTGKCPFGFRDEKKIDHWIGGEAPLNIPEPKGLN